MMKKLPVKVTPEDIRYGEVISTSSCAIAHAINRQYPGLTRVDVRPRHIAASDKSSGIRYFFQTPDRAVKFIMDFDKGGQPNPISFTATLSEVTEVRRSKPGEGRTKRVVVDVSPEQRRNAAMARRVKARSV